MLPVPILRSAAMKALHRLLRTLAPKDVGIALVGESGTGKEVLARRIHELSHRRGKPFVPINCAAIPEQLFESELFGHEKGAFTGATERARGKIEAADGGTLFLDEVAEMPLAMQAKLLRFLESRKFMRVGGTVKISVDARLVFATLRPLEDEVKAGRFRPDLYYRIMGVTLRVPPLRERRADLPELIAQLSREIAAKHDVMMPRFSRAAMGALRSHEWGGNVRELKNVLELVILLRERKQVRLQDLPLSVQRTICAAEVGEASATVTLSLDDPLRVSIGRIFEGALRLEGGNQTRAAARLGVSLRTVQRHLSGPPRKPAARARRPAANAA
ncbi:MAG: sigma-54-dependent Fis family transcriptional regulator [Polyangiaceae bacterium]|nr:sigma-54-dependent Fis family transcriptional regulator [Polyangiaceae bacterium]MBK8936606.1 sigma-54-dependent Fis family transcriptional regulator [Polyangiaceae bacterium]